MYELLPQWLKTYFSVQWIVLESSSIYQQSDRNFYPYTTFLFHFTIFLIYNQLMSTKKLIASLCDLYSAYEERPE